MAYSRRRRADVDARGKLIDGTPVDGPVSLREALVARSDLFFRAFTEKLLTYALGRGLEYYDMPVVRSIVRDSAKSSDRFSAFALGIVERALFNTDGRKRPRRERSRS